MSWIKDVFRLLAFVTRWSGSLRGVRALLAGVIFAGALSGLANVAFLALINALLDDPAQRPSWLLWGFVGLCVLLPVSRFVSGALLLQVTSRTGFELRTRLGRKILASPLSRLEELGPHRLLATMTEDIPRIITAVVSYPNLIMQLFIVVGCLAYLAWLSPAALGGVLAIMTVGILTHQLPAAAANRLLSSGREDWDILTKSIRGIIEGTKELKLNQSRRREFFAGSFDPAARSVQKKSAVGRTILHAAACWGHVLFFIVIGVTLFYGPSVAGVDRKVLTGFTLVILYMITPIESILSAIPELVTAAVSVRKIETLGLSLETELDESDVPVRALPEPGRIELEDVRHVYSRPGSDETFELGPVNLTVQPGELLFLTGGNGSGKTTLAKLLCGLYAPDSGEMRFDGQVVDPGTREAYRQNFSAVFADFFVFESLLGLNGTADAEVDEKAAGYLSKLRLDGVLTVRDGAFSRIEVSQGQRKRLALVTSYLEDRPIYLFDEWAADQDVDFREFFYRQLLPELKARGKTAIVISHDDRYYGVADRVIKMDFGRIAAEEIPGEPGAISALHAEGDGGAYPRGTEGR